MYFADLTPYTYGNVPTGLPRTWNVGWLSSTAPFARGTVDREVSRQLARLVRNPVRLMRGRHECEFCHRASGNGELWILDADDRVYAAPCLISHYVNVHQYRPPTEFLDALRASGSPLSEADCHDRICRHLDKLHTSPQPEDILVPYYSVAVYWHLEAFSDLEAFQAFLLQVGLRQFNSCVARPDGFAVLDNTHDPKALLIDICAVCALSGPAPFKCTFTLQYLEADGRELFAEEVWKPKTD